MKMVDRIKTVRLALEKLQKGHAIVCTNPNEQMASNAEGMCGIVCFSCGKVIELPKLSDDLTLNKEKWFEAMREARTA